jgi:hypothetical protein
MENKKYHIVRCNDIAGDNANHKLNEHQKHVYCHFLHLFKRQLIHKTNPDKVQTELTLTQTYETIYIYKQLHNIPPHKENISIFLEWSESFCV